MSLSAGFSFGAACSGNQSEEGVMLYASLLQNDLSRMKSLGGWFADTAKNLTGKLSDFVNSRVWELGRRLDNIEQERYIGPYDIGYLGSISRQQEAEGIMRNYIMSNPSLMDLYQKGLISGYDGGFSNLCSGIGNENIFYRLAMDGVLNLTEEQLKHSHYHDSVTSGLSFLNKVDIQRTWNASNYHLLNGMFDMTSINNAERKQEEKE